MNILRFTLEVKGKVRVRVDNHIGEKRGLRGDMGRDVGRTRRRGVVCGGDMFKPKLERVEWNVVIVPSPCGRVRGRCATVGGGFVLAVEGLGGGGGWHRDGQWHRRFDENEC